MSYIIFCGPFVIGCAFYIAKFVWLVFLKQPRNSFYDMQVPMRWWFFNALWVADIGFLVGDSAPGILMFFSLFVWFFMVLYWREHVQVFQGRFDLPTLRRVTE